MRTLNKTGGNGWVCPMCGMNVNGESKPQLLALWQVHVKGHGDDLIENVEAMLQRCVP